MQMSRALAIAGAECSILTFNEGLEYRVEGVRIEALPTAKRGPRLAWEIPKGSQKIISELVAQSDVVHMMGFRSLLNAAVFRQAKKLGKKVVICPAGSIPSYGGLLNRLLKLLFDLFAGNAMVSGVDACIAVTEKERGALLSHGFGEARTYVMPNSVFSSDFKSEDGQGFRDKYGLGEERFILFLGRLAHIKGPDLLLEAFAGLPNRMKDCHLVFAGPDAGIQAELERMVEEFGVSGRTHFIGHIGQPDKSHAYHAAELVVVPSRQEAMSIVALEAGITGTPVLITDACGFDALASIDDRLIVKASVEGVQAGLVELLGSDGLVELGDRTAEWLQKEYSWERMAHRYLDLYRNLIEAAS